MLSLESTAKIRTYSPPRRESIEDHLAVLASRSQWLAKYCKINWKPGLATATWVRSLTIKPKNILNGPVHRGAKAAGAGVQSRFTPRDYRDLLEVIRLKSQGIKRRNAWIVHLWFRGHEYPTARVHKAVIAETRRLVDISMREIAPTGRFKGDFAKRARRVSPSNRLKKYEKVLHFFYALMTRPSEIRNLDISAEQFATLWCEDTQTPVSEALPLVERLFSNMRERTQQRNPELEAALLAIAAQSPHGRRAIESMRSHPNPHEIAYRMHGILSNDRGQSRLAKSIENADENQLRNARNWRRLIRSSAFSELSSNLSSVPPEYREATAAMCDAMLALRRKSFASPDLDVNVFAMILDHEMPVAPPDLTKAPVEADAVLRILRDNTAQSI